MDFKLIAKVEEALVFEVGDGLYVTVYCDQDKDDKIDTSKVQVNIPWTNPLGRFAWSYTKCSSDPLEEECISVIEKNKEEIVERLNRIQEMYNENPEMRDEVIEISNEYLDGLKDGERVDLE